MSDNPFENPSGTREEILAATSESLRKHGYADLTINKIGDEFEKSQSLIYHHYDGKDDLVLDTLQQTLNQSHSESFVEDVNNPQEQLAELVETFFGQSLSEKRQKSLATVFELRAQAIHNEDYRKHFSQSDSVFEEYIVSLIQDGMDDGVFQSCNPATVASMITTMANGALVRRSTGDSDDWINELREEFQRYLEQCVYKN